IEKRERLLICGAKACCRRVNGIGQGLGEKAGLQDAKWLEVMLVPDVVVIAFGWLQGGITNDYLGKGRSVWIDLAGGHNVREIGPRDINLKDTAKNCVLLNLVLHLNAGQNVHVAGAAIDSRGWQDVI